MYGKVYAGWLTSNLLNQSVPSKTGLVNYKKLKRPLAAIASNYPNVLHSLWLILTQHFDGSYQCYMPILGTRDMSSMAVEHKNCEPDAHRKNAHCHNWTSSEELLQGLYSINYVLQSWVIVLSVVCA